jgi:hypothetical protein
MILPSHGIKPWMKPAQGPGREDTAISNSAPTTVNTVAYKTRLHRLGLVLKLSPHSCHSDQPEAKQD